MPLASPPTRKRPEPTIALINVVFLMLIFFMIAGALAPTLDDEIKLIATAEIEGRAPPDTVVVHADGRLEYRDASTDPAQVIALTQEQTGDTEIRMVVDRDLPAQILMDVVSQMRAAGATEVWIVTERGL